MIDYKETQINIKPDKTVNITTVEAVNVKCKDLIVEHSNTIELGKGATEKLVLGDTFMKLFNQHQHIGNLGAPTSPPVAPMTPTHLSQKKVVTL